VEITLEMATFQFNYACVDPLPLVKILPWISLSSRDENLDLDVLLSKSAGQK
jgi:hypothetical protein